MLGSERSFGRQLPTTECLPHRPCSSQVLCTTSTLAMGVNLPAHLVVLKGTVRWVGDTELAPGEQSGYKEYSQTEVRLWVRPDCTHEVQALHGGFFLHDTALSSKPLLPCACRCCRWLGVQAGHSSTPTALPSS